MKTRAKERGFGSNNKNKSERHESFMRNNKSFSQNQDTGSRKRRNLDKFLLDNRSNSNQARINRRQRVTLEDNSKENGPFDSRSKSMKRGVKPKNLNDVYQRKKFNTSMSKRQNTSKNESMNKPHSKSVLNNKRLRSPGQNIRLRTSHNSRRALLQNNIARPKQNDSIESRPINRPQATRRKIAEAKLNQLSQPQNTTEIDKDIIKEVKKEKHQDPIKFENKDIQVNPESLNNTSSPMIKPQEKPILKNMILDIEDDVISDKTSEKSIQILKTPQKSDKSLSEPVKDPPPDKTPYYPLQSPHINSTSSLHLQKDLETRINASLYKPSSSHLSSTSVSSPDWASLGLHKLFCLLYSPNSRGMPSLNADSLSLTQLPQGLENFVFSKYSKNGPEIFDETEANVALKYVKKGIKQRLDRTVGDSSEG